MEPHIDRCSPEGITIGILDAMMTLSHFLQGRDMSPPGVQEALGYFEANFYVPKRGEISSESATGDATSPRPGGETPPRNSDAD